ncbi:MAG: hypothetical protein RR063_10290, partial [Anaerovoracaceae bacterium]
INKKGQEITIQIQACKEITKMTNYKCRRNKTNVSFEAMSESELPFIEANESDDTNVEEPEINIESLIEKLELNEKHLAVLNCRLNGMSFPQIAQVIQRATSTAYDYLQTIQRRYMAVYG